jgi:hypothetical protein
MKATILSIILFSIFNSFSQNTVEKADDISRICLSTYISGKIGNLTEEAKNLLLNKLNEITTKNGMGGGNGSSRFIITTSVSEITKDITASNPPIYQYELAITLYIGDGIDGTKFSSYTFNVKGNGNSETKAYITALKQIKPSDVRFKQFIDEGKTKIVSYYNAKCDFLLKEAQTMASKAEYDAAIAKLFSIPEVCKECFDKAMNAVPPIYQMQIDRQCKKDLMEANNVWSTNQDYFGAEKASAFLANIDPNASCFSEAKVLNDKIAKKIKEIDQREWSFTLKQQQDAVDIEKASIKAARDIGVAYGENQPDVIYETAIYGWW